jgi:hypothetical protein
MQSESDDPREDLVRRLTRIRELLDESIVFAAAGKTKRRTASRQPAPVAREQGRRDIDLSMPIRAFVKRFAGGLSGPKKFTLLLAHLAKGDVSKNVSLELIEKNWNKMTAKNLLGMKFNRFYSNTAKDHDWVNTDKPGLYHLRPSWKAIFDEKR